MYDYIVVGSGAAGVHAAYPLVQARRNVAMLDGGLEAKSNGRNDFPPPSSSFTSHAYDMIIKDREIFEKTYQLLPVRARKVEVIQTLAKGGLLEIWGGVCDFFSKEELEHVGLPYEEMEKEYENIKERIKIRPSRLDYNGKLLLKRSKRKPDLAKTLFQPPSAPSYHASSTLQELSQCKNFTYIPNQLVLRVKEGQGNVEVQSIYMTNGIKEHHSARFVILAAGSINTTRILLRSLDLYNEPTSFLTKPHVLTACLDPRTLGKFGNAKRSTRCQIVANNNNSYTQLYSYGWELHKLLPYIPLPKALALKLLAIIAPSLIISSTRFPAFEAKDTYCVLRKTSRHKDVLEIYLKQSVKVFSAYREELKKINKLLLSLGLLPLKTMSDYATAHYAGGIPFQRHSHKTVLSADQTGKLDQGDRIYIADSSTWRALPAKPPAISIMANASRVAKYALTRLPR